MDVNDASNYSGSNVQAYRDNNSDAQRWFIYSAGNGYYYLRPKCSDSAVLDLYNRETSNGTNIQIWTTNQTGAQKWKLEKVRTEFTIQYNANGGSGTPESQKKQAEKALTLSKASQPEQDMNSVDGVHHQAARTLHIFRVEIIRRMQIKHCMRYGIRRIR